MLDLLQSMRIRIFKVCVIPALAFANGCGTKTVFVPEASPMRIAEPNGVRMHVYHRIDGVWTRSNNTVTIPEGWYLLPPSFVVLEEP